LAIQVPAGDCLVSQFCRPRVPELRLSHGVRHIQVLLPNRPLCRGECTDVLFGEDLLRVGSLADLVTHLAAFELIGTG
jgi:hypothetical protein